MNVQGCKIFALVMLAAFAAFQQTLADSSLPKPPGLYDGYTATLLPNGKCLVAGGETGNSSDNADVATLYDPATGTWATTGKMSAKRRWHVATLLSNGKVLVAGGQLGGNSVDYARGALLYLASAETYDPDTGTWTSIGSMNIARAGGHTLTLLSDGRVLVAGGTTNSNPRTVLSSVELYNPATGKWAMTTPMNTARYGHAAVLLTNGFVLVAGGMDKDANFIYDAELYSPSSGKWAMTGSMPDASRYFYSATLLANGQVLLTTRDANAWAASKVLYEPSSGQWKAIGPSKPHFVSSINLDRTLTISPESGSAFLASEEIEFMVQSADRFGVTNIQLLRDNVEIGEGGESPFRYTVTNMAAGTYTFLARAAYANGMTSTSSPVSITFKASEPQVSLAPGPTEFISETHVKTSPATLLTSVVGVDPGALTKLTLNGSPQPLQTGNFILHPPLTEGKNEFVLLATDKQGRTGKATTEVYLDSIVPTISIKEPADGAAIDAMCVDMHGTFAARNLKQITVSGAQISMAIPASVRGNTFEARNVFLTPGANTITAVVEDLAGNAGTNTITIIGPTDTNTAQTFPVQIQVSTSGGFEPLPVTYAVQAHVPGKIQKVIYDFDGDNIPDQTNPDLQPVTHIYKNSGEYFPVVTIQTTVGRFSSLSGMLGMFASTFGNSGAMAIVNVQTPPVLMSTIKITDPVDVKWTAASNLYVLSGSTATITEFDANGKIIRSLSKIGSNPSGLDVDASNNVYVAMTGDNQVWKFKPSESSFTIDTNFSNHGEIGMFDGDAGSDPGWLKAPFDVAVAQDGQTIAVSDSGNNRIQRFTQEGRFVDEFGKKGRGNGQLNSPKGLAHDEIGIYLFIVDSGNDRIILGDTVAGFMSEGSSGTHGAALGQFNGANHLSANKRALYVADTGNNRVQVFSHVEGGEMHSPTPFNPRVALAGELGLNHPKSVAAVDDFLEEKLYIADTGNNRVILVKLPLDNPEAVWKHMIARLKADDVPGALSDFSMESKEKYQQAYQALSKDELLAAVKDMENIKPATIESDHAQCYFESVVQGQTLTFPVEFDKEFGQWKIMEY
jgi:hypothetical protein